MTYQHNFRPQFGDTTYIKVFVGGLAWETPTDKLHQYFEQFGEILEAVVITDKITGRSKGYGFVTFRDPESARNACAEPNPIIDGRRANCNIAAMGRPRPSPPRGTIEGGNIYYGGGSPGMRVPLQGPQAQVIYPPYGYTGYAPNYGYHHAVTNANFQAPYYTPLYGTSSSTVGSPYFYGYSLQNPRGAYPATQAHVSRIPSYLHYPAQGEGSFTNNLHPTGLASTTINPTPPSADTQTPQRIASSSTTTEVGVGNSSESPDI